MSFLPPNYYQNAGNRQNEDELGLIICTKGWVVESESQAGTYYLVRRDKKANKFYCSCMHSSMKNVECKHCERVRNRFKLLT